MLHFQRRSVAHRACFTTGLFVVAIAVSGSLAQLVWSAPQLEFEAEPIHYASAPVHDRVAALQAKIDGGSLQLDYDPDRGYLPAVLEALGVSPSTQMLVFSKTSFQLRRIAPETPRAVYFGDDVYVGWVPDGDVIEVSTVDPELGAIFYTLGQQPAEHPKFLRDQGNCLTCHASSRTQGVPGHLVRSVYAAPSGQPHFGAGTFHTNHASPLKERWGGWYVTGTHGQQRHMGNVTSSEREPPYRRDVEAGANRTELDDLVNLDRYLSGHSDIVALMVLEHQTEMHNWITLANFETRLALHHDGVMNQALERPADYVSETTARRINAVTEKLVRYLLFADEASLTDPIAGTSDFATRFAERGPTDARGRSLRQFDLQQRLFKYPCSYLIYSEAFLKLPAPVKQPIYRRLWEILTGQDASKTYAHLSVDQRQAIREILLGTHPDLPDYWRAVE